MTTACSLQENVITLQQSVINVLREAVSEGRTLTETDMRCIIQAQNDACDGSIAALNSQRDRMLAERGHPSAMKRLPASEQSNPNAWEVLSVGSRRKDSPRSETGSQRQRESIQVAVPIAAPLVVEYEEVAQRVPSLRSATIVSFQDDEPLRDSSKPVAVPKSNGGYPDRFQDAPAQRTRARSVLTPRRRSNEHGNEKPFLTPPVKPSSVSSPISSSRVSKRGSPPPGPRTILSLPAPPVPIFCRYSRDLQRDPFRRLDKSFSTMGSKNRCPSCEMTIPVDTRDVWILSTQSGGREGKSGPREYRVDARFVVKCHTAKGNHDGNFACLLCERYRDVDCITKGIDGLLKHLGTAHTPAEFERDPDLVRMREGSMILTGKSGRELVLV